MPAVEFIRTMHDKTIPCDHRNISGCWGVILNTLAVVLLDTVDMAWLATLAMPLSSTLASRFPGHRNKVKKGSDFLPSE